ncbi:hypothetical protein Z043_122567, partial [Scleropages formosus]
QYTAVPVVPQPTHIHPHTLQHVSLRYPPGSPISTCNSASARQKSSISLLEIPSVKSSLSQNKSLISPSESNLLLQTYRLQHLDLSRTTLTHLLVQAMSSSLRQQTSSTATGLYLERICTPTPREPVPSLHPSKMLSPSTFGCLLIPLTRVPKAKAHWSSALALILFTTIMVPVPDLGHTWGKAKKGRMSTRCGRSSLIETLLLSRDIRDDWSGLVASAALNHLQAELDLHEACLAGMEQMLHNLSASYNQ